MSRAQELGQWWHVCVSPLSLEICLATESEYKEEARRSEEEDDDVPVITQEYWECWESEKAAKGNTERE